MEWDGVVNGQNLAKGLRIELNLKGDRFIAKAGDKVLTLAAFCKKASVEESFRNINLRVCVVSIRVFLVATFPPIT